VGICSRQCWKYILEVVMMSRRTVQQIVVWTLVGMIAGSPDYSEWVWSA